MGAPASFTIAEAGMFTLLGRHSPSDDTTCFVIVNPDLNLAEFYNNFDVAKTAFVEFTQGERV